MSDAATPTGSAKTLAKTVSSGVRRGPGGDRIGGVADGRRHPARLTDQRAFPEADRERELRLARRAADDGHVVLRQVRRRGVGHRFYAGCQNVDTVETLAAEHARELFGAPYAYAQPHSGIDANLVAFWSILAPASRRPR